MDDDTIKHAWQAFSTLSDAQELAGQGPATDMINHAKRHLLEVLESAKADDGDGYRELITATMAVCPFGDDPHTREPVEPAPTDNSIQLFFHCAKCLANKPDGFAPQDWSDLAVGWSRWGVQVWCKRHQESVVHLDFGGMKVRTS